MSTVDGSLKDMCTGINNDGISSIGSVPWTMPKDYPFNSPGSPLTGLASSNIRTVVDSKIGMMDGDIHIQAVNNGFMLTTIENAEVKVNIFGDIGDLISYVGDLHLLTVDMNRVITNV